MTFAAVRVLRNVPGLAQDWIPKLTDNGYDAQSLPVARKSAATVGMD